MKQFDTAKGTVHYGQLPKGAYRIEVVTYRLEEIEEDRLHYCIKGVRNIHYINLPTGKWIVICEVLSTGMVKFYRDFRLQEMNILAVELAKEIKEGNKIVCLIKTI